MLIDIACNATLEELEDKIDLIIESCKRGKIFPIFVGLDYSSSLKCIKLAEKYKTGCYIGIHPCHLQREKYQEYENELNNLDFANPRVIGIGETGLDYYRSEEKILQHEVFKLHLRLNKGLPYFYHCRSADGANAYNDFIEMEDLQFGVVHSFDGTLEDAKKILNKGRYIGINGCSLKTKINIEVVRELPIDKILIETDSPYCLIRKSYAASAFVQPIKSRNNEPINVKQIAEAIAKIKNIPVEQVMRITYENTLKVFPKVKELLKNWE